MSTQLNIEKLLVNMSAIDRAKLLVADAHSGVETLGKKHLLSVSERNKLFTLARKQNHIYYINKVMLCLKITTLILVDLDRAFLLFGIVSDDLQRTIQSCYIKSCAEDVFWATIYDQLTEKYKDKMPIEEYEKKVDEESQSIYTNSDFSNGILKSFDYFEPPLREHSYFDISIGKVVGSPNKNIVDQFFQTVKSINTYRKRKYEFDLVQQEAVIDLLTETQHKDIAEYEEIINQFTSLQGLFSVLKIYTTLEVDVPPENHKAIDFIKATKNIESMVALTDEQKKECEEKVTSALIKN